LGGSPRNPPGPGQIALRKAGKQEKEDKQDYQQDKQMGLEHEELCGSVIGAVLEVHKALGPIFLESVYENVLALVLAARGVGFELEIKRVIASQRPYHDLLASWLP
jgi:hypothetical protein